MVVGSSVVVVGSSVPVGVRPVSVAVVVAVAVVSVVSEDVKPNASLEVLVGSEDVVVAVGLVPDVTLSRVPVSEEVIEPRSEVMDPRSEVTLPRRLPSGSDVVEVVWVAKPEVV